MIIVPVDLKRWKHSLGGFEVPAYASKNFFCHMAVGFDVEQLFWCVLDLADKTDGTLEGICQGYDGRGYGERICHLGRYVANDPDDGSPGCVRYGDVELHAQGQVAGTWPLYQHVVTVKSLLHD